MIIGLDVGGTHTDAVLISKRGLERKTKVPTKTTDLFNTVLSSLTLLLKDNSPDDVKRIVLSTTLTTNAVVQENMPPVGIIVSAGPGIAPEFFRTGANYYPVSGSIDHRGRERQPINGNEITKIAEELKSNGIKSIGIIGKFSVRNPAHELEIKKLMGNDFDTIFLGHNVSGNLNFPRRISTVHLNAAVYSMHRDFFNAVEKSLEKKGIKAPIQILKADGGTMNLKSSMKFPGQSILSGPAASVMGSIAHAQEEGDTLVLDIGGTTTDIAILVNKVPLLEPVGIRRGKYKSLIRSLKTYSKGIGGDSEVRVENGILKIGPLRRGPAMAFGGHAPTPTDAMVHLGIMKDGNKKASRAGMQVIGKALGMNSDNVAQQIFEKTCELILDHARKMVHRINTKPVYTVHEFLEGYAIKPEKILLLGGPAKYFASTFQKITGIPTHPVPASAVANAIGAALARTTCEISFMADTEQGIASAPEEDYTEKITKSYTEDDAVETAYRLLHKKAIESGSDPDNLEIEIIEHQEFNIVRDFFPRGKIHRIKIQVKPGLIRGYNLNSTAP